MKADTSDAPERVFQRRQKRSVLTVVICLLIGGIASIAALQLLGRAPISDTAIQTADAPYRRGAVVDAYNPVSGSRQEVSRISEMPPGRDLEPLPLQRALDIRPATDTARQTVFNDQNFVPRGADNVFSLRASSVDIPREEPLQKVKLTVVRQSPSMKERACWPFKQGSVEYRNCRSSMGLKYRD